MSRSLLILSRSISRSLLTLVRCGSRVSWSTILWTDVPGKLLSQAMCVCVCVCVCVRVYVYSVCACV